MYHQTLSFRNGDYPFIAITLRFTPRVVASERVLSEGQIELFDLLNSVKTNNLYKIELLEIEPFVCK